MVEMETNQFHLIDKTKFKVYSDLDGYQTPNGGTIPASMTVTELKPDIVIVDKEDKNVNIVELTVPFEHKAKKHRQNKQIFTLPNRH